MSLSIRAAGENPTEFAVVGITDIPSGESSNSLSTGSSGELPRDATFWSFLFSVDRDLAESARREGCRCGGRLHGANYPRKPRGVDDLPEAYAHRLSFCCDRDGCRKPATPPSVRFLGRKWYLGAVVNRLWHAARRPGSCCINCTTFRYCVLA